MPRASQQICEHEANDRDKVPHSVQKAWTDDFVAIGPVLCIVQLTGDSLSVDKQSVMQIVVERYSVDVIDLQQSYVDVDFRISGFDSRYRM